MKQLAGELELGPGFKGFGPLGLEGNQDPYSIFNKVLSGTIGIMTAIAAVWFIFLVLTGAYAIMQAGADKQALEDGKKRILNGVIGLVFIIAAIFLVDIFGTLIGIPDILNPGEFIKNLGSLGK